MKNRLKRTPIIILNGFLGSGKTTLFRNLLFQSKKKNLRVCAIVNDMSELDIDGELLGTTDVIEDNQDILESISSVVLSSKKGIAQLDKAVSRLRVQHSPELIIIETSGSCHPMPLVQYFKNRKDTQLKGLLVLVDSLMLAHDFSFGAELVPQLQYNLQEGQRNTINLLVEQIMFCSHLMLTKADRIGKEKLPEVASHIQSINPFASIHSLVFGRLNIESLLELEKYDYYKVDQLISELQPILDTEKNKDRPYDLATRVINDDRPFHPQRLWNVCHSHLDKRIYRSKGFFWLASRDKHSLLWNQAAGGINLELIGSWRSGIVEDPDHGLSEMEIETLKAALKSESGRFGDRHCDITIIGESNQVDVFTEALESCFLNEKEIELWESGFTFDDPWPKKLVKLRG